jgi:hypothetical protein
MGREFSMNGEKRPNLSICCWWEIQRERGHKEDQDIGGWLIIRWILER